MRVERLALMLGAAPALLLACMGFQRRWVAEDAFISLRVVEHLLAGRGPVFNAGERVEAYTHPLWIGILALWGLPGLPLPYGAVILGLLYSISGLLAAQAGSRLLLRRLFPLADGSPSMLVPAGALVFAATPVVWDYATSGLETGLTIAWLGLSFWLFARTCLVLSDRRVLSGGRLATACVVGLGPLIRPDLALFSVGFVVALAIRTWLDLPARRFPLALASISIAAGFLPVAYEVFRMGYFGALVPNPALAKEAGEPRWSQGWAYLWDFAGVYHLWIPLTALLGCWSVMLRRTTLRRDRGAMLVLATPVLCATLHALYVMRVGGDFMHGRLLLPSFFGLLLPVMLLDVPIARRSSWPARAISLVAVTVIGWSIVAAVFLRVPYPAGIGPDGIADERGVYADNSGHPHPITLDDYVNMRQSWARNGLAWRALAERQARVLLIDQDTYPLNTTVDSSIGAVALSWNVGIAGYAAGPLVHVVDRHGLSDPIASRVRLVERGRPGHEKELPPAWTIARFAATPAGQNDSKDVIAARDALACGELAELLDAVQEPMSMRRFFTNIRIAFKLHHLRIAPDPAEARSALCD